MLFYCFPRQFHFEGKILKPDEKLFLGVHTRMQLKVKKLLTPPISSVLTGGRGQGVTAPLPVKYEGLRNGNVKHMGTEGDLVEVLIKKYLSFSKDSSSNLRHFRQCTKRNAEMPANKKLGEKNENRGRWATFC